MAETTNNYVELSWVDSDGKPQDIGWGEDEEGEEEQITYPSPLPRDVLDLLKENLACDAVEDPETPGDRLLSALISYLRQDYQRVLALLYRSNKGAFGWASAFWLALACLELHREADAQTFLQQIEPGTRLPPALLAPLRWTQTRYPTFFASVCRATSFSTGSF